MLSFPNPTSSDREDEGDRPDDDLVLDPRKHPKPVCSGDERLCSVHGMHFGSCITECIPVTSLNLQTVKEDCYFATDALDQMSASHKRNMVYWWYATNVYSIAGREHVERMPACLEYAIRDTYRNLPGVPYSGYKKARRADGKKAKRS